MGPRVVLLSISKKKALQEWDSSTPFLTPVLGCDESFSGAACFSLLPIQEAERDQLR